MASIGFAEHPAGDIVYLHIRNCDAALRMQGIPPRQRDNMIALAVAQHVVEQALETSDPPEAVLQRWINALNIHLQEARGKVIAMPARAELGGVA